MFTLHQILLVQKHVVAPICPILTYEVEEAASWLQKTFTADARSMDHVIQWKIPDITTHFERLDKLSASNSINNQMMLKLRQKCETIFNEIDIEEYLGVSQVEIHESMNDVSLDEDFSFQLLPTRKHFCARCRLHKSENANSLCNRCQDVENGFKPG